MCGIMFILTQLNQTYEGEKLVNEKHCGYCDAIRSFCDYAEERKPAQCAHAKGAKEKGRAFHICAHDNRPNKGERCGNSCDFWECCHESLCEAAFEMGKYYA